MVVVLQEQNADVPPNLPTAAGAVSQTAATLAKVAQQLAVTSYKNFEEISSEIVVSATAVQDANATMQTAMQSLTSSPDRKVGWAGLVESCRIMAAKTIKLLQIVYGAELKRLFAVADGLLGDLSTFKTALAQDDPQGRIYPHFCLVPSLTRFLVQLLPIRHQSLPLMRLNLPIMFQRAVKMKRILS
jgi:hypothetical protein